MLNQKQIKQLHSEQRGCKTKTWTSEDVTLLLQQAEERVKDLPPSLRPHLIFEATSEVLSNHQGAKRAKGIFLTCTFLPTGEVRKHSIRFKRSWARTASFGRGHTTQLRFKPDSEKGFDSEELLKGFLYKAKVIY